MKSNKAHDPNGYEWYPLNLRSPMVEQDDLQYFHAELKKASPSLFVENANECQVRIFEAVVAPSEPHIQSTEESGLTQDDDESCQKKVFPADISSLVEIQDVFKVIGLCSDCMHL